METNPYEAPKSHGVTASLDDAELRAELERRFADPGGAIAWSELRDEK